MVQAIVVLEIGSEVVRLNFLIHQCTSHMGSGPGPSVIIKSKEKETMMKNGMRNENKTSHLRIAHGDYLTLGA